MLLSALKGSVIPFGIPFVVLEMMEYKSLSRLFILRLEKSQFELSKENIFYDVNLYVTNVQNTCFSRFNTVSKAV